MDQLQKTVANTGNGIRSIDKTKKILLIGNAKKALLLNRQETYRVYQCDTVRQHGVSSIGTVRISSCLISPTRHRTDYPLCKNAGCWRGASRSSWCRRRT